MTGIIIGVLSAMAGGTFGIVFMCVLQINRNCRHDREAGEE